MVQESQTPRVTTIQVRVDCNGCAQKIKKALNGINGIHNLHIDFDRQRLTIIGWADPEKMVKAIKKKARKNATIICSNIETSSSKPTKPKPKENPPAQQAQGTSFPEPMWEATSTSPTPACHNARKQWQHNPGNEGVEQVNMLHHHQPNHVNRFSSGHDYVDHRDRSSYHNGPVFLQEASQFQPLNVTHSYNTYKPSSYVTEYECVRSSSWYTHYRHMEHYNGDYNNNNVNIAAMFSDDNPNSCCIV
ncbi:Heavy metal transport/detoxification superfamily protein [Trifolium repens]|nr:Heavy metal transport/detoxification superfamily protein [Trifolium repens]